MGSTPVSGGQQEVFPFAYLQSALTHMFEEPEHAGSFTYPCALMLAIFTGELESTQGQILRAAALNTPDIQTSFQKLNAPLFKKQHLWRKDLCLPCTETGTNSLSAQ